MKNRQEGLIQHSIVLILNFLNADNQTTEEKDAKKKSYTSSELNIIVIYLWVGSKITVPCTNGTTAAGREGGTRFTLGFIV